MTSQEDMLQMFQVVTGASEQKARQYLEQYKWKQDVALSQWYDKGEVSEVVNPLVYHNYAPPIVVDPIIVEDEPFIGTLPGLYNKKNNVLIPLKSIDVRAKIIDFIADVEITQKFVNDTNDAIEVIFKFEHYEAALTNFEVEIDEKIYKGICKETNEAVNNYEDAISSGYGAYLVEQNKENIIKVSIGNLPPHKECRLTIRYVSELVAENNLLKFYLPITRTPLTIIENTNKEKIGSGLSVFLELYMRSNIIDITCESHKIKRKLEGSTASLFLQQNYSEGREFEIFIKLDQLHVPSSVIEIFTEDQISNTIQKPVDISQFDPQLDIGPQPGSPLFNISDLPQSRSAAGDPGQSQAIMLSFYPTVQTTEDSLTEIIFLVDRSGSMAGSRINQAKNALQLFCRSLPRGTLFNIIGFGSTHQKLFPTSRSFDDNSLSIAAAHITEMQADLGGTNILSPLREILTKPANPNYPLQIFCLTDGEVSNTEAVLNFIKMTVTQNIRIFTFGIGAEASKLLVRGIAKYGRGKDEFVLSGERIEGKVMKQLKRALSPILVDIKINWGDIPIVDSYFKLGQTYPPIFDGEKLIIYNFIQPNQLEGSRSVIITGKTGEQVHQWEVPVDLNDKIENSLIHRLTAKQFIKIQELNAEQNKEQIIQLATKWGLVSKYTSFIALEERDNSSEASTGITKINVTKVIEKNKESHNYIYYPYTKSEGNRFISIDDTVDAARREVNRSSINLEAAHESSIVPTCSSSGSQEQIIPTRRNVSRGLNSSSRRVFCHEKL